MEKRGGRSNGGHLGKLDRTLSYRRGKYTKKDGDVLRLQGLNKQKRMEQDRQIELAGKLPQIAQVSCIDDLYPVIEFMADNTEITLNQALKSVGVSLVSLRRNNPEIYDLLEVEMNFIKKLQAEKLISESIAIGNKTVDNPVSAMWFAAKGKMKLEQAKMKDATLRQTQTTNVQVNNTTQTITGITII